MTTPSDATLHDRLARVQAEISDAAHTAGRPLAEITTIVVTKFHPASLVRELFAQGVTNVGENRVQDAAPKAADLTDLDLTWHFIGQLQSNKVRTVLDFSHIVHSVDRDSLVTALDAAQNPVDVFIQLNLTDDEHRGGVRAPGLRELAEKILQRPQLKLLGLMAVAPLGEEPRRAFERVRRASDTIRELAPEASALSMGMSGDFREAIAEGATHLRIGTAITGNRPGAG